MKAQSKKVFMTDWVFLEVLWHLKGNVNFDHFEFKNSFEDKFEHDFDFKFEELDLTYIPMKLGPKV